jgi:hypothetical protein
MEIARKTERVPSVIFADLISCLVPEAVVSVVPSEFCAYTVSVDPNSKRSQYSIPAAITWTFLRPSRQRAEKNSGHLERLPQAVASAAVRAQSCSNCREAFSKDNYKVRHHNHRTGNFIGALCNSCNLHIRSTESDFFTPVIFHNLKNYDAHIFGGFNKCIAVKYKKGR